MILEVAAVYSPLEEFPFAPVRALILAIYLTFVPGYLLLRILRIHRITGIESLVFAVAFSLAAVMFTGFAMNFLLPMAGIPRPMSEIPLILTLNLEVIGLLIFAYARDGEYFTRIRIGLPLRARQQDFTRFKYRNRIDPFGCETGTCLQ
jgi:uncharacterized membrane protein